MSQPKRYSVAVDGPWFGDGAFIQEDGKYVLYSDYAALAADFSQMTAWGRGLETDKRLLAEKNAALAAENERLRKASFTTAVPSEEYERVKALAEGMYQAAVQDSTGLWLLDAFEKWHKFNHPRTEGGSK